MSDDFEELHIKLPKSVTEWLKKISRDLSMEPSNFIVYVLETYKTIWEKGFERGQEEKGQQEKEEKQEEVRQKLDLESIIEEFKTRLMEEYKTSKDPKKKIGDIIRLIEKLFTYVNKEDAICNVDMWKLFEEYKKNHNLTKNTEATYRSLVKKFIKFLQEKCQKT